MGRRIERKQVFVHCTSSCHSVYVIILLLIDAGRAADVSLSNYINDVIVVGRTFEDHFSEVLSCVKEAVLKLKLSKCALLRDKVAYLEHVVSHIGVAPDRESCLAQSVKDVQKFLELTAALYMTSPTL